CEVAELSKTVGKRGKGGKPGKEMALFSDKMCSIKTVGMEFESTQAREEAKTQRANSRRLS
ncbi:MAG: hypothetical protein ACXWKG_18620, partial [Limisphaerales bacterium]